MYSVWAQKQHTMTIYIVGGILVLLLAVYIAIGLYEPPSCFDGKKNQNEIDVDCGGGCELLCTSQVQNPRMVWVRSFKVSSGIWSAFAYLENPNPDSEVREAHYKFTLYDKRDFVIKEVEGTTYITQDAILPVFEGRIDVGDAEPYRTEFKWTEPLVWHRPKNIYKVEVEEQKILNSTKKPEITGGLINREAFLLEGVEVFVIVYNTSDTAIAVSKTYVESISAREKKGVTFSWLFPFDAYPYRWQVIARVPPQEDN